MQRGEHEVAGESGLDSDSGSLTVADLSDEHHIRVLPEERSKCGCEGQPCLSVDLYLVHTRQPILHRVLDSDDVRLWLVEHVEGCVQRCRLAGSGRTHHQNGSVWFRIGSLVTIQRVLGKPEVFEFEQCVGSIKKTHDDLLAIDRGERGNTQVELTPTDAKGDSTILRSTPFGDIDVGHDLES